MYGRWNKNRPFTAQEVRNLLLNDSDEETLSDDDYHCSDTWKWSDDYRTRTRTSELETESETDTDQVDNVPDNERHAVILLLFMGVGEPICAPSRWWILPILNCTTARYSTGDSVLWCFDCHILLVCQANFSVLFIIFLSYIQDFVPHY